jgi:acetolactate synthase-1/2/3 large subunit
MRFVDWLASRLEQAGTRFAFGVPGGGSNLDLLQAMRARGLEVVLSAREDAAVIMAGVAGALAGAPGLAFSTKGPGLASASNGLACAALDRLPALLIGEAFETAELDFLSHQVLDQRALVEPLLDVPAGRVLTPDVVSVQAWLGQRPAPPRGPAVLLASGPDFAAPARAEPAPVDPPAVLGAGPLGAARTALEAARRPVLVLGLEATRGLDPARVRAFAEALGAPVLCTYMAKGLVPDAHPQWAGLFTGGAIEQPCVNEADLIVTIGLDPVELIRKPWPYRAPVLDLCEHVHRPHYFEPAVRLCAPLGASVPALAGDLGASTWKAAEIDAQRRRFLRGMTVPTGHGLDSSTVVQAAVAAFAGRPRLTVDAGAHMFSACAFWPCDAPLDLLISNGLATMGFALPAAIAAALHDPSRGALAMTGDGGLMMCLGELKTAAQTGAQVCIVVFNDARLSLIDIKREDRQLPDLGLSWRPPDFAAVARGLGLAAWRVDSPAELHPALAAASARSGPRLVDVRIDSEGYREQLKQLRG